MECGRGRLGPRPCSRLEWGGGEGEEKNYTQGKEGEGWLAYDGSLLGRNEFFQYEFDSPARKLVLTGAASDNEMRLSILKVFVLLFAGTDWFDGIQWRGDDLFLPTPFALSHSLQFIIWHLDLNCFLIGGKI